MADDDLSKRLEALGFADKSIKETIKNKKVSAALAGVLDEADIPAGGSPDLKLDPAATPLLTALATATKDTPLKNRAYIAKAIRDGKLKTNVQVNEAVKYVKSVDGDVDATKFDEACGVGVSFTKEQVVEKVSELLGLKKDTIVEERYKGLSQSVAAVKDTALKWAAALDVKNAVDEYYLKLLGPKDERDTLKKPAAKGAGNAKDAKSKGKDAAAKTGEAAPSVDDVLNPTKMFKEGFLAALHKPGGNKQLYPENMEKHLAWTKGRVFTRFPPEPNGFLHIGHSKAIAINFGFAKFHGGECYLRYDDTNPEAEEERFFVAIKELIEWLGFKPYKITHSSDHFQELYDLAEELILRDKGYVCHCTAEEMFAQRGGETHEKRFACKHRDRPIEESLTEFRAMKDGKYKPKEAVLRMKQDILNNGNPQMWDLPAYRILDASHHRTGNTWKIYPTYDFTHCLCDSFENISHSLCTTEFIQARESYDWLCDALGVYRPQQSEYGRLSLTGTIMSKRKIAKLVELGHVRDWDDPRLYTLSAIRRRGVPPGAILSFVNELGVTTAKTIISEKRFENSVRRYLEETVPRLMLILDPVPVILENLPEGGAGADDGFEEEYMVPFKPNDEKMGEHAVPFTRKFYIDRSDFREEDSKDYFRMAPGKSVGLLRVPHTVRATSFTKDPVTGLVTEIRAHYENDIPFKKPKTYIQWVADAPHKNSPVKVEARVFHKLFKSDNPEANEGGYLADLSEKSQEIYKDAVIDIGFHEVKRRAPWPAREGESGDSGKKVGPESTRFQALRVGYFALDSDSTDEKIVLNRIVSLKEDTGKSA